MSTLFSLLLLSTAAHFCQAQFRNVRLRGGATRGVGKVEVVREKDHQWGGICDDEWGIEEADVVCKQLGFIGAKQALTNSFHGAARGPIWMKSVECGGHEKEITDCSFVAISQGIRMYEQVDEINDCATTHLAGVVCEEELPALDLIQLGKPMPNANHSQLVTMEIDGVWMPICTKAWTSVESIIACKQAGRGFANLTIKAKIGELDVDGTALEKFPNVVRKIKCYGTEDSLQECRKIKTAQRKCKAYASITCSPLAPDISVNITALEKSINVFGRPERKMVCAKSEGCMSDSGMIKSDKQLEESTHERRLLVFSSNVQNFGNADFRPPQVEGGWHWHECHEHFHSITDFATYELINTNGKSVASGHKVSFCLRDNFCVDPSHKKYECSANSTDGNQGISIGCADHYKYTIDCQWIDVTDVAYGRYYLEIKSNPYMLVPEQDYLNNYIRCQIHFDADGGRGWNCHHPGDFDFPR